MNQPDRLQALLEQRAEAALAPAPAGAAIPRLEEDRPSPLSAAQSRLWFIAQYEPDSAAYNVPVVLRLRGALDRTALLEAVRDVAERHRVLRSAIRLLEGEPASVTLPAAAVPVRAVDTPAERLDDEIRAEAGRPFALDSEPPLRAVLFGVGEDDHVLALTLHHIAFDDWSYDLLIGDLAGCYSARLGSAAAPPLPALQHADVAAWERSAPEDPGALAWWRERLAGLPPLLELPADSARPAAADWTAAQVPVALPAPLAERLRERAAETGCTPYMVLMAAWQALLGRLAGVDDVAVGVPEAGRRQADTESVIGCFVNTLVARTDLSGDPTGRELLGRVRDVVLDAFAHSAVPFDAVVRELQPQRSPAGAPLVQVLLNVLDQPEQEPDIAGLRLTPVEPPFQTTQFDATLNLRARGGGYEGALVYRADLFEPATARRWARWFRALLDGMLADLDRPVSGVELLDPAEHAALVAAGAGPALPADRPATVLDAVLDHARRRPGAVAVRDADGSLRYDELAAWSLRAATAVHAARGDDAVVGVCLPRDRHLPAALLAVLRAGAAYLPLEPGDPEEHLGAVAADAGVRLVVSRGTALVRARAIPGVRVLDLDEPVAAPAPLPAVLGDDLAYLLYTSGSTGAPKGVEITHANLAALATAMRERPGIGPADTFLALAPLTFDASAGEIWATLAAGGCCYVATRDAAVDGHLLAERIADAGVTAMLVTPTTLRMLLAAGWDGDRRLRLSSGGERLDAALARDLLDRVGELWNAYGPTEATMMSAAHRVTAVDGASAPIGSAMPGERLYVMDPRGRLAPPGVIGELWIGGAGVGRGYRGRPDLTRAAFVPDPVRPRERCYRTGDLVRWRSGGVLEFVGRRDGQVKVRGHRIELGGVEAALLREPEVADAAVLVHGSDAGAHLVGYVTPASVSADALRAALARRLPDHMVPRRWVALDRLPLLPSGKVDRGALPAPGAERDERVAPAGEAELLLAEVWEEVLDRPAVGAQDDFFALGGHSLAATRVAGRLTEALGCRVPVRLLFDRPVLADLALEIERLVLADLTAAEDAA